MGAIEHQPFFASVSRAVAAMAQLGSPLSDGDAAEIQRLSFATSGASVGEAERILSRYTIARVALDAHGYATTTAGGAEPVLVENGWSLFLVRVENPHHVSAPLLVSGTTVPGINSNLAPATVSAPFSLSQKAWLADRQIKGAFIEDLWLAASIHGEQPLSGFDVEYRVVQLFSRNRGERSAYLAFSLVDDPDALTEGRQGLQIDFHCASSREVTLRILDHDARGCVASLVIRDGNGRVYPPQAMRIAPDMRFQPQIYRGDGESVWLPDGDYDITVWRGPEYLSKTTGFTVSAESTVFTTRLERWIDPGTYGWYPGETHIHGAGCAHYEIPTEGVGPETMIRQVRGEALAVGSVLTWGPGYYHQRQYFTGAAISPVAGLEEPDLQRANNARWVPSITETDDESVIRYDLEVSGFPSSHSGHIVLLGLANQDYPGTDVIEDWPSWNLPVLQWGRADGALAGFAHCAIGMAVDSEELPNLEIPAFDGIGTNEAIIDVTHGAVDFLSGCEVVPVFELNAWYHMLNCGFRVLMVGETDYPCITDDRPGLGRTYVNVESRPRGDAGFRAWLGGLRDGESYFGDGRIHFLSTRVAGHESTAREIRIAKPSTLTVNATVAAWLEPEQTSATEAIRRSPAFTKPVWHLERARIDTTREVEVELVVNGEVAAVQRIVADGSATDIAFDVEVSQSSWLALRCLPSGHTQPLFVTVAGAPVRASEESALWCRSCVDKIWDVKSRFIRPEERAAARDAYDHARTVYESIAEECRELSHRSADT